jgi:hypothetical protein
VSPKSFVVHIHGGRTHTVVIALTKIYLADKSATVKDESVFGMKHNAPCVPDVWAVYDERIPMGGGRYRSQTANLIVEVESSPTKASIAKKNLQYQATLAGVNLVILDLNTIDEQALNHWPSLLDWIGARMPI